MQSMGLQRVGHDWATSLLQCTRHCDTYLPPPGHLTLLVHIEWFLVGAQVKINEHRPPEVRAVFSAWKAFLITTGVPPFISTQMALPGEDLPDHHLSCSFAPYSVSLSLECFFVFHTWCMFIVYCLSLPLGESFRSSELSLVFAPHLPNILNITGHRKSF